ncbi:MAG TPA: purine-nucleoside phosphorylase [Candidatus Marinimicrobia bacterium]|nr:purine-nucleoside phosphorylase [Candidatus Neomarinimicrobiota bacterium]
MKPNSDIIAPIDKLAQAEEYILSKVRNVPDTAVVLGSGLGYFANQLTPNVILNNRDIPHFPQPGVVGHEGKMIFGSIKNANLIAIQGRSHYYEGKTFSEITFYVQLLSRLGVKKLVLTNAAGGMNPALKPGDLVLLKDYINFTQLEVFPAGQIPKQPFSESLATIAKSVATELKVNLTEGVYCWTTGPSYETHAEVQIIRDLGADVVGMSTVPELLVGAYLDLHILGISLVTNLAAGIGATPLTHAEVRAVADEIKEPYSEFMSALMHKIITNEA